MKYMVLLGFNQMYQVTIMYMSRRIECLNCCFTSGLSLVQILSLRIRIMVGMLSQAICSKHPLNQVFGGIGGTPDH